MTTNTEASPAMISEAGGLIAIQSMLSLIFGLYIGGCPDRAMAQREIMKMAEEVIDTAAVPGLPHAEQQQARSQAKRLARDLIMVGA